MTSGASGASDTVTASGTATTTASGTATAASQTGGETEVDTMATATTTAGDTDSVGGSESSSGADTDGGDEQVLCEHSGGVWDLKSCGHYTCGLAPDCDAVVPGCDCGVGSTFAVKVGCFPSPGCEPVEFACGGDTNNCSAPGEYCEFWGASVTCLATPDECEGSYTCSCLEAAGVLDGGTCNKEEDLSLSVFVPGGP